MLCSFPPTLQGGFFCLYSALLLLQPTGLSDANSPGKQQGSASSKRGWGWGYMNQRKPHIKPHRSQTSGGYTELPQLWQSWQSPLQNSLCLDVIRHPTSWCCRRLCLHSQAPLGLCPKANHQPMRSQRQALYSLSCWKRVKPVAKWVIPHVAPRIQGSHSKSFQEDCMTRHEGRESTGDETDEEKAIIPKQTLCPSGHPRSTLVPLWQTREAKSCCWHCLCGVWTLDSNNDKKDNSLSCPQPAYSEQSIRSLSALETFCQYFHKHLTQRN